MIVLIIHYVFIFLCFESIVMTCLSCICLTCWFHSCCRAKLLRYVPSTKEWLLTCKQPSELLICSVKCEEGFVFEFRPPMIYYCQGGEWGLYSLFFRVKEKLPWPNCKVSAINFMQSWADIKF